MGITGVVGSYTTTYGGTPGRLHNVQLVAELIDGALVAPGARFSFNQTTGERNEAKGFEEAPVIINGELESGIGGGVCQVSTTRLQRRVRGGPLDRQAHEPRALHQPLPARPRRDGQLPGHRPRLHERHRQVAARPHLRRRRARSPSTSTGHRSNRRVETETAPLDGRRQGAVEADRRRHDVQGAEGRRAVGRARRARRASRAASTGPTGSCSTTRPGARTTSASRPSSASGRSRGRSRTPPTRGEAARGRRRRRMPRGPPAAG